MAAVEDCNGIDFSNPTTDKPANLANSAVLRMLEEEERNRRGYPSQKKVVWPPVPETNGYHQQQQPNPAYNAQQPPAQPQQQQYQQSQYQPPQSQPQYQAPQYQPPQNPQYQPPQNPQYQPPQNPQYQPPQNPQYQQQQQPQSQPAYGEGRRQEATGLSKLIPVGPGVTASPAPQPPFRQGPASPGIVQQQHRQPGSRWAPVPAPLSPQTQGSQPSYPQQQYSQSQYSPSQYSPQPQYSPSFSEPAYQPPQKQYEPPPSTITLRPQQPVHQQPPPVFASQPATASFQGGINMRGDQKWPPQSVKEAVAAENEARRQLAKGPACRPRKVKKDYSQFFAQNGLNNNYPGYRAPPGTQHYEEHSGRSSY